MLQTFDIIFLLEWWAHILQRCLLAGCLIYLERIRQRYLQCFFWCCTVENIQIKIQLAKSVDSNYAKETGQTWQIVLARELSQIMLVQDSWQFPANLDCSVPISVGLTGILAEKVPYCFHKRNNNKFVSGSRLFYP